MPLSVVLNLRGDPEPPGDVVRRLAAVDPGLTLKWSAQHKQWAVWREWPENDRRWQWVQEQRYSRAQAHDILGHVPNDCAVDQVPAYVSRILREFPTADAKRLLERMTEYNDKTDEVAAAVETVAEQVAESMTAPKTKGRRVKVTPSEA